MAEDDVNKEDKFEFTSDGEALGYIGLDQAVLLARQSSRQLDDEIRQRLNWATVVWETSYSDQREDSYQIVLRFRPPVRRLEEEQTGEVEFLFSLVGELIDQQVIAWPEGTQERVPSVIPVPETAVIEETSEPGEPTTHTIRHYPQNNRCTGFSEASGDILRVRKPRFENFTP